MTGRMEKLQQIREYKRNMENQEWKIKNGNMK